MKKRKHSKYQPITPEEVKRLNDFWDGWVKGSAGIFGSDAPSDGSDEFNSERFKTLCNNPGHNREDDGE